MADNQGDRYLEKATFLMTCLQIIKQFPNSKLAAEAQRIIDAEHKRMFGDG